MAQRTDIRLRPARCQNTADVTLDRAETPWQDVTLRPAAFSGADVGDYFGGSTVSPPVAAPSGEVALAAVIAATSTMSAAVGIALGVSATISGASAVSASAGVARGLSAAVAVESSVAASVGLSLGLASSIAGVASFGADLRMVYALSAAIAETSSVAADLTVSSPGGAQGGADRIRVIHASRPRRSGSITRTNRAIW